MSGVVGLGWTRSGAANWGDVIVIGKGSVSVTKVRQPVFILDGQHNKFSLMSYPQRKLHSSAYTPFQNQHAHGPPTVRNKLDLPNLALGQRKQYKG